MTDAPAGGRGKQKMIAGIFALLLGGFGAHHFYLGSTTSGIITIAVVWLTCGAGAILPLIEGVMLLIMSDADFDAKYNAPAPQSMEFVFQKK